MNIGTKNPKKRKIKRAPRVICNLPVEIEGVVGSVQNMSTTGVYIELDDSFEPNSIMSFSLDMDTPGGVIKFDLTGKVVRVSKLDGKIGVGLKITKQLIRQ
jgi:hypothetical protein